MKAGPLFAVPVNVFQRVEVKLSPLVFGLFLPYSTLLCIPTQIDGLLITMQAGPLFPVPVDVFQSVEEKLSPLVFGLKEKPIEKQE